MAEPEDADIYRVGERVGAALEREPMTLNLNLSLSFEFEFFGPASRECTHGSRILPCHDPDLGTGAQGLLPG
jgi:hypothetical protein